MKKTLNNKTVPKVTLILQKDRKKVYLYPSLRKTQFFLKNKAEHYFKSDYLITIRVSYNTGEDNTGTYDNIDDLTWAFQAFVKEYTE